MNVPESGDFVLPALNHVGLYSTEPAIPQFEQMAVNLLDASESNILPAEKAPGDMAATIEDVKTTRARLSYGGGSWPWRRCRC